MLSIFFPQFQFQVDDNVDLNLLATHTPDCSGSDIREVRYNMYVYM